MPREIEGQLSARGLCSSCGLAAKAANIAQLAANEGPYFDHYLMRTYMATFKRLVAAGLIVLDEPTQGR